MPVPVKKREITATRSAPPGYGGALRIKERDRIKQFGAGNSISDCGRLKNQRAAPAGGAGFLAITDMTAPTAQLTAMMRKLRL